MRLFFGPPDAIRERRIHPTARPLSYQRIEFDLDGESAVVTFAPPLNSGITSVITAGGQELPLMVAAPGAKPADAVYLCL